MKTLLLLLLSSLLTLAQGYDVTFPLPVPGTNVAGIKLLVTHQDIGSSVIFTRTNHLPATIRSLTFTNLFYGTNTFTLIWTNALGDSPPSAPLILVSVPLSPSTPQAPPPFGAPTIVLK